jgi:hypothetical protein
MTDKMRRTREYIRQMIEAARNCIGMAMMILHYLEDESLEAVAHQQPHGGHHQV